MATLALSYNPATNRLDWTISGLSAPFDSSGYIRAGICISEVSGGQLKEPLSIITFKYAPSFSDSTSVSGSFDMAGWNDYTYTIYGFTQINANGSYWPVDSKRVSIIKHWSWSDSNGSATAAQTQAAYAAITGKGQTGTFSHLVWNDLCKKVWAVVLAEGTGWWTDCGVNAGTTPAYNYTIMSTADKTLTAARFNALRGNIGGRVSTGVNPVSKGDKVYGSYFTACTNALNTWISNITS